MPIYEYKCDHCKKEFEKLVFAGDKDKVECPECKSLDVRKKMSAVSFMGNSMGSCATSSGSSQFS